MNGLKCLTVVAILRASTSHGSYVTWCFLSFALKKPARWSFVSRVTYRVAPIPCLVTEPSVTIHSWSDGRGRVMDLCVVRDFWAEQKSSRRVSVHCISSPDCWPVMAFSNGAMMCEHFGSTRPRNL